MIDQSNITRCKFAVLQLRLHIADDQREKSEVSHVVCLDYSSTAKSISLIEVAKYTGGRKSDRYDAISVVQLSPDDKKADVGLSINGVRSEERPVDWVRMDGAEEIETRDQLDMTTRTRAYQMSRLWSLVKRLQ